MSKIVASKALARFRVLALTAEAPALAEVVRLSGAKME
ncbi:hypothetical protein MCEZE4_01342 [Burkholderiaceae bacterium]|jgi:hypothetical protein